MPGEGCRIRQTILHKGLQVYPLGGQQAHRRTCRRRGEELQLHDMFTQSHRNCQQ